MYRQTTVYHRDYFILVEVDLEEEAQEKKSRKKKK